MMETGLTGALVEPPRDLSKDYAMQTLEYTPFRSGQVRVLYLQMKDSDRLMGQMRAVDPGQEDYRAISYV